VEQVNAKVGHAAGGSQPCSFQLRVLRLGSLEDGDFLVTSWSGAKQGISALKAIPAPWCSESKSAQCCHLDTPVLPHPKDAHRTLDKNICT